MNFRSVITKLPATNMSVKASKGGKSGYYFLLNTLQKSNSNYVSFALPYSSTVFG